MATIDEIKEVRDLTGAGINAVREALNETGGNKEEAIKYLRKKGMIKAVKRGDKNASEGIIGVYVHSNHKFVVTVEVNTETDFAAKSDSIKKFADDIALHVAAVNPLYVSVESIPTADLNKEKEFFLQELSGKPESMKDQILEGKLQKFYSDTVLIKQSFFLDNTKTVEDLINDLVIKIGEKIVIKSFYKFEVSKPTIVSIHPEVVEDQE